MRIPVTTTKRLTQPPHVKNQVAEWLTLQGIPESIIDRGMIQDGSHGIAVQTDYTAARFAGLPSERKMLRRRDGC
jgi:hypothetical protein